MAVRVLPAYCGIYDNYTNKQKIKIKESCKKIQSKVVNHANSGGTTSSQYAVRTSRAAGKVPRTLSFLLSYNFPRNPNCSFMECEVSNPIGFDFCVAPENLESKYLLYVEHGQVLLVTFHCPSWILLLWF